MCFEIYDIKVTLMSLNKGSYRNNSVPQHVRDQVNEKQVNSNNAT